MWPDKLFSPILIFVALLCCPVAAVAQRHPPTGDSTISGRVVFADNGRPARRATVRLYTNMNYPPARMTPANVRGEFRFNRVAAGSYFVVAEVPGGVSAFAFAITEFGYTHDEVTHTRVTVDGKSAARCEVRVMRAGTVTGTILYADKEPVTGAHLSLFLRKNGSTVPFVLVEPVYTNDRGMYRIDGLPEGDYFVGVVDTRRRAQMPTMMELRGVVSAYYPGGSSIADAKSVHVQSGSEVDAVNITLGDDDLRQIAGVIKLRNRTEKIAKTTLALRRKDEPKLEGSIDNLIRTITPQNADSDDNMFRDMALMMLLIPPILETNGTNEWSFQDVPRGTYLLTASVVLSKSIAKTSEDLTIEDIPRDFTEGRETLSGQLELTVGDEDLKDVVIEVSKGGRIFGQVVAEETPLPRVQISASHDEVEFFQNTQADALPDGSFVLQGLPRGEVRLDVAVVGDSDSYVKSITLGSQDLVRNPIRMEEGVEVSGVRITLGKGLATVKGRALFEEGGSVAVGGGVLLVKADPALWHLQTSRLFAVTDHAGQFELKCPPGQYLVFTWAAGNQPLQPVQEFVRTHASKARSINLQSNEDKQIELTIVKPKKF